MNVNERKRKILAFLAETSDIPVSKISELLKVSVVTIRSDLNSLASEGLLARTHGGALPAFHQSILDRQKKMVEEKHRIARVAAEQVNDGDKIMIIAGTTAWQQLNGPSKFTRMVFWSSASGYSHNFAVGPAMPALLTRISMRPNSFSVASQAASTLFGSPTSTA